MTHKIWFNIQRLWYSLKGINYKGSIIVNRESLYEVGDFIKVKDLMDFPGIEEDGVYKVWSVT